MWYNGKFSPEELKELGWEQFDLKIMKADLHYVFNADEDLQNLKAKQEYLKITIDFLKECLTNITWRHQTIRNTIDWRKFMAGN
jgi:hypothetical protein